MNAPRAAALAVLALGVLSADAAARAPSASQELSMDWLRERLRKDRTEKKEDPFEAEWKAFEQGTDPIEGWKKLEDGYIQAPAADPTHRRRAAQVLVNRIQVEQTRMDAAAVYRLKKGILAPILGLMTSSNDRVGMELIGYLTESFFPKRITPPFSPKDPVSDRKKCQRKWEAYVALKE